MLSLTHEHTHTHKHTNEANTLGASMGAESSKDASTPATRIERVRTHQGIVEREVPIENPKIGEGGGIAGQEVNTAQSQYRKHAERVWGKATPFTRVINPELHMKPNKGLGAIGFGLFCVAAAWMTYIKLDEPNHAKRLEEMRRAEEEAEKSKEPPKRGMVLPPSMMSSKPRNS